MGKVTEPGVHILSTALCALCTSRSDAHRPTLHTHTHSHTLSLQHSHTHHTPRHSASSQSQLSPTHGEPPGPYSLTHSLTPAPAPRRAEIMIHSGPSCCSSRHVISSRPPLVRGVRDTRPSPTCPRARYSSNSLDGVILDHGQWAAARDAPHAARAAVRRVLVAVASSGVAACHGAWSPQRVVASARGRLSAARQQSARASCAKTGCGPAQERGHAAWERGRRPQWWVRVLRKGGAEEVSARAAR
jgi:hypothetical protein